jgi:hypothetical protein
MRDEAACQQRAGSCHANAEVYATVAGDWCSGIGYFRRRANSIESFEDFDRTNPRIRIHHIVMPCELYASHIIVTSPSHLAASSRTVSTMHEPS